MLLHAYHMNHYVQLIKISYTTESDEVGRDAHLHSHMTLVCNLNLLLRIQIKEYHLGVWLADSYMFMLVNYDHANLKLKQIRMV